jgi:hypothetical protein
MQPDKNDSDSYSSARQILLALEVRVERYENIKRGVRQSQQFSVLLAGPTGVLNRYSLISMFGLKIHERTRRTLIDQDLHQRPETRLRQASSSAATASSRLTLGYCFKN